MRHIIHEMPYEVPVAYGVWRYARDGQATGAVEAWRLTEALDGFRFLRVDLDARQASSGRSYLYHLVLDGNGRPVQLKFRLWEKTLELTGTALLEEDALILTRETKEQRFENVYDLAPGYAFWFPASTSLALLARLGNAEARHGVTLQLDGKTLAGLMSAVKTEVHIAANDLETIVIQGQPRPLRALTVSWHDQQRTLWLDESGWPLKIRHGDGLVAEETRYIKYARAT